MTVRIDFDKMDGLTLRNLDSAPFGGRLGVGALGVLVSLTRPAERERGCNSLFDNFG